MNLLFIADALSLDSFFIKNHYTPIIRVKKVDSLTVFALGFKPCLNQLLIFP